MNSNLSGGPAGGNQFPQSIADPGVASYEQPPGVEGAKPLTAATSSTAGKRTAWQLKSGKTPLPLDKETIGTYYRPG